jgi:hypothetical protein
MSLETLETLRERARIAALNPRLVQLARQTPTQAYDTAREEGIAPQLAESCHALAMIGRDYGAKMFKETHETFRWQEIGKTRCDELLPRLLLVEAVTGTTLLVTRGGPAGMHLRDFMRTKPTTLDLELSLGELRLVLQCDYSSLHETKVAFTVRNGEGVAVIDQKYSLLRWGEGPRLLDEVEQAKETLDILIELIGNRHPGLGGKPTLIWYLAQEVEKKFGPLPECLNKGSELRARIMKGEWTVVLKQIEQKRILLAAAATDPARLAFFEEDARKQLDLTEKRQRYHNPRIPLLEKLLDRTVEHWYSEVIVVPGAPGNKKQYNFLLWHSGSATELWMPLLQRLGYSGSTVLATVNFPTGFEVGLTGQLDGIIMHDTDPSPKSNQLFELLVMMQRLELKVPQYLYTQTWPGNALETEVRKSLQKMFPV